MNHKHIGRTIGEDWGRKAGEKLGSFLGTVRCILEEVNSFFGGFLHKAS